MITKEEAKYLGPSLFNGTEPFLELQESVGHFASQRPEVLLKGFSKRRDEDLSCKINSESNRIRMG